MIKINSLLIIYVLINFTAFHAMDNENSPLLKKEKNKITNTEKEIQKISSKISKIKKKLNEEDDIEIDIVYQKCEEETLGPCKDKFDTIFCAASCCLLCVGPLLIMTNIH